MKTVYAMHGVCFCVCACVVCFSCISLLSSAGELCVFLAPKPITDWADGGAAGESRIELARRAWPQEEGRTGSGGG